MSGEKRNRLLDAPDEALRDILAGLENQQTEGWRAFWKQLVSRDLQDLTQMSLTIAMRVLALSQQDPDKAIKYFRDQQIMPFPRFLPKSELARFGDFFEEIMAELEWGKDVKAVRKDSGKMLNVHLYNIRYLFDDLRGVVHEEPRYILYKEDPFPYDVSLLESIKQLPDLDQESVGEWARVIRDWLLAIDQLPWEERYWVSPDPNEEYPVLRFPYHEGTYWVFINEIKKGLEKETQNQLATRTKNHDKIERKAVKNLSKHYNVKMEGGFPKEWEDLNGHYEDFAKGKKWEDYVWVYHEYLNLERKRQDSLDGAEQAAKSKLLHDRIRKRLAEMVS